MKLKGIYFIYYKKLILRNSKKLCANRIFYPGYGKQKSIEETQKKTWYDVSSYVTSISSK